MAAELDNRPLPDFRDWHAGAIREPLVDQPLPGDRFIRARTKRHGAGEQTPGELHAPADIPLNQVQGPLDFVT